jgi:hypothetical protein
VYGLNLEKRMLVIVLYDVDTVIFPDNYYNQDNIRSERDDEAPSRQFQNVEA